MSFKNTHYVQKSDGNLVPKGTIMTKKAWGAEFLLRNEEYCIKFMELLPGHQVSVHFHKEKVESFVLLQGSMTIEVIVDGETRNVVLKEIGESFTIGDCVPHTYYVTPGTSEKVVFLEASTKDSSNDSYRITKSF
jgi:mannose-6-phosphate isomerase-like protein (cupin superfamily)